MHFFIFIPFLIGQSLACPNLTGFYPRCFSEKGIMVEVFDMDVAQSKNEIRLTATHPRTLKRNTDVFTIGGEAFCSKNEMIIKRKGETVHAIMKKKDDQLVIQKSLLLNSREITDTLICR